MQQLVHDATHKDGHTLDLVFSNPDEIPLTVDVKRDFACTNNPNIKFDHYPLFFDLSSTATCSNNQTTAQQFKSWRNINNLDMHSFKSALNNNLLSLNQNTSHQSFEEKLISFKGGPSESHFSHVLTLKIHKNLILHPNLAI